MVALFDAVADRFGDGLRPDRGSTQPAASCWATASGVEHGPAAYHAPVWGQTSAPLGRCGAACSALFPGVTPTFSASSRRDHLRARRWLRMSSTNSTTAVYCTAYAYDVNTGCSVR